MQISLPLPNFVRLEISLISNFLSTDDTIDDSGRVSRDGQLLFPPFTELGWDQYATKYEDTDLENIAAFSHIGGFGRPM